jgi:hypothetical protein
MPSLLLFLDFNNNKIMKINIIYMNLWGPKLFEIINLEVFSYPIKHFLYT